MPGTTGKRAKTPGDCRTCGEPIGPGDFMRESDGDEHTACWWKRHAPAVFPCQHCGRDTGDQDARLCVRCEHAEDDARDADDSELRHYYGGDDDGN